MVLGVCVALLASAFAAYHFWPRPNTPSGTLSVRRISQWNKPINNARLSPDGHALAFDSPVGGIPQIFLMLASGGEPLQLTNDEGDKFVNTFSPDGKEIYYGRMLGREEVWAVPTLGGTPRHAASAGYVVPSLDGSSIFYGKYGSSGIYRSEKSGLNEELVYDSENTGLVFRPLLLFPGGDDLLAYATRDFSATVSFYKIKLTSRAAVELGEVSGNPVDAVWAEPGKTLLFSRNINGLTNIWSYNLNDRRLTQITFGTGPDYSPMVDLSGKGIYFVNGRSSGSLTVYHVQSKESTDIVPEEATQPSISPDNKRVMYITSRGHDRSELWVADIDGANKVKVAGGDTLGTGAWAPDNLHLSFSEAPAAGGGNEYLVASDGSGLLKMPQLGGIPYDAVWSPEQKSVFASVLGKANTITVWRLNADGSSPEMLVDNCGYVSDADPSGQYLLGVERYGEKNGIYQISVSDRRCTKLLPDIATESARFARDGKSFLYAVAARGEVTIYRQPWKDGKTIGAPQIALKIPFTFPLDYGGNAYDFSRDLSTLVYARPGGHADLYLLSQK